MCRLAIRPCPFAPDPENDPMRFVVLPTRGLRASPATSSPEVRPFLARLSTAATAHQMQEFKTDAGLAQGSPFQVIDAISEDGAKLVEMTVADSKAILAQQPGLRIVR